jgi:putative ABC transport system permease protein
LELGASTAPDVLIPPPAAWRSEVNRGARRIHTVLGRLEDGWSVKQTEDVLSAVASGITATHLEVSGPESVEVTPLPRLIRDSYGRAFYLLWAGCGVVLLVACVNLASLLIARGLTREREMAVRASLGASRTRLFRQLTTEAFVLGAVGGLAAIPVAHGVTRGLVALFPGDVYRIATAAVDLRALGFLTMASALAAVAFGLVPALRGGEVVGRGRLGEWLRYGARSRLGVLRALVVGEVALTLTLVASGGLLLRSYLSLTNTNVGFEPEGVVHFWVGGSPWAFSKYEEGSRQGGVDILRRQLRERIAALPDVVSVAEGQPPLSGAASDWSFTLADRPPLAADARVVFDTRRAGPGYFATLGIPLREGRYLDEADEELSLRTWGSWGELRQRPELSKADVTLPAVVNETLARRYWPGESAIGKGVYRGAVEVGDESEGSDPSSIVWDRRTPPFTVVGVVGDVKTVGLDREPEPTFYSMGWGHSYLARVRGDPRSVTELIRREVETFDPALTVGGALPMEQRIADIAAEERFRMLVIVAAAAMALILAAVGLSAVVAYSVNQRRHEIGVRISLGAKRAEVLSLVGWQAVKLVSVGAAIGLALVAGLSRLLGSFLYGVAVTDPLTFLGSLVLLGSVCVLASYLPARHAARVDPMEVLKME